MSQPQQTIITLVGCGKMGSALLNGWLNSPINAQFNIIEPNKINIPNVAYFPTPEAAKNALNSTQILILAVKPQIMPDICAALKPHISSKTAILSIAAGQTIENFETHFGKTQPIIRAMPNTPAAIGKGISVAITNAHISAPQKELAALLLQCAGKLEWITDENLMDAVTAISGSGPAYIFHLIEILTAAGNNAGLPPALSTTLARQTVIGSAALAETEPQTPAETLRKNVTSPGGTTAAALEILMNGQWQEIFNRAITAAKERGIQLRKS